MSLGWVKLKIFSRLGEMSLGWVKLKIVLTKFFYTLGEMSGEFGETSYNQL